MNLNDSKSLGSLLEADLDEAQAERSPAPRVPRMPYGCDQQGRYPMAFMPAECCTDIGAEDDTPRAPLSATEAARLVVIAVTSLSIVAALAVHLWRAVA